jgi:hypothetical protein
MACLIFEEVSSQWLVQGYPKKCKESARADFIAVINFSQLIYNQLAASHGFEP